MQDSCKYYQCCVNCTTGIPLGQPQTNKIIQDMAFTIDIRDDIYYRQGLSDATEKAIIKMLTDSDLTIEQIANFLSVTVEAVIELQTDFIRKKNKNS